MKLVARRPVQHVVQFSGGKGSWAAAKLVAQRHGTEHLTLLFADTLMEDWDLYRFIEEAAANVGGRYLRIAEGRDPWQVFEDKSFIGNTRVDPCSYSLKRMFLRRWLQEHCVPSRTVVYLGIDWTEMHRYERAKSYWVPWTVQAPLCEDPSWESDRVLDWLVREGITPPRLYGMGFAHNNCGGFCIKAGQGHFKLLLEQLPDRYAYHEEREERMRARIGDVAILRDRSGGTTTPLSLRDLRLRVEAGAKVDVDDIGGCNCVNPDAEVDAEVERLGAG